MKKIVVVYKKDDMSIVKFVYNKRGEIIILSNRKDVNIDNCFVNMFYEKDIDFENMRVMCK